MKLACIRRGSLALVTAILWSTSPASAQTTCGGDSPCRVADGEYRIVMPPGGKPAGVYVFFHGYRGSAAEQMRSKVLIDAARAHRFAFAAVDGLNGTWSYETSPSHDRDEYRFISEVLDDLQHRFGFGPDRVVIGGFSQGASMAWYAACHLGDRVAAMVTFSGVFWDPLPQPRDCETPPPIIHFHGRNDQTFPLAGRAIGERWHQGDTFKSLAILKLRGACGHTTERRIIAGIACELALPCARGPVALCIHDGGHELRAQWLDGALAELPALVGQVSTPDGSSRPARRSTSVSTATTTTK